MQEDNNTEEYVDESELENKEGGGWKGRFRDFVGGRYFVPIVIILIAIIAFSLGRISGLQEKREPVRVLNNAGVNSNISGEVKGSSTSFSGAVVASKNGTKYHYPWCAGAKQISEKNKISFNSVEDARAAGYSPASNCKGLK